MRYVAGGMTPANANQYKVSEDANAGCETGRPLVDLPCFYKTLAM